MVDGGHLVSKIPTPKEKKLYVFTNVAIYQTLVEIGHILLVWKFSYFETRKHLKTVFTQISSQSVHIINYRECVELLIIH